MPTYGWLIIIVAILLAWWLWSQYSGMYLAVTGNPKAIHAGLAIDRYYTDITGLIGAYQAASDTDGPFMSRLGAFFGRLPT